METIFALLALISLPALLLGIIKPSLIVFWSDKKTRGRAIGATISLFILATFGFALTADIDYSEEQHTTEQTTEQQPEEQNQGATSSEVESATPEPQQPELSEAEKKEIYKAIVAAEDRGRSKAEEECPTDLTNESLYEEWQNMDANEQEAYMTDCMALKDELSAQYRAEVIASYDISTNTAESISTEGTTKSWPLE